MTLNIFYVNLLILMVNVKTQSIYENLSTKSAVLHILREHTDSFLSGEKIADAIGKSRVSVWKAIQALEEAGYGIESQTSGRQRGYTLIDDIKDALYEWEFLENEPLVRYFDSVESTMNEARKIAMGEQACENDFYIIVADTQTKGRGTKHKQWESPKQGLFFTLLITKEIETCYVHILTAIAQIALAKTLNTIIKNTISKNKRDDFKTLKPFRTRWPNDIWAYPNNEKTSGKIAGILTEYVSCGNLTEWCSLGIGLNIETAEKEKKIASFCEVLDYYNIIKPIARKEILNIFLKEFKELFSMLNKTSRIKKRWNLYCADIETKVKIKNDKDDFIFDGIDNYGWAVLSNGKKIAPGEKQIIKD